MNNFDMEIWLDDSDLEEQLRQLQEIEDGAEDVEHPDTQYSDYPWAV